MVFTPYYTEPVRPLFPSPIVLVLGCLLGPWGTVEASPVEPPERVLFVMVDTLRPDHLGIYGYDRPTSPKIDALAREGVVFLDVRSTSAWTKPAVASLLTGVGPWVHGVEKGSLPELRRGEVDALAEDWWTLPEAFRSQGFVTVCFSANPHVAERTGLAQGFDQLRWGGQRGENLTQQLKTWLEAPYDFSIEALKRYAASPQNRLTGWRRVKIETPASMTVERDRESLAFRRVAESKSRGARIEVPLGAVPAAAAGRWVLVVRGRHSGQPRVKVLATTGEETSSVLQLHSSWAADIILDHVVLDSSVDKPKELVLEVVLNRDESSFELFDAFLVPESEIERSNRWFVYAHYMHTHLPYPASAEYTEKFPPRPGEPTDLTPRAISAVGRQKVKGARSLQEYEARYDASIHEVDTQLGQLIEQLKTLDLLDGTLIIVTSDHGDELMDHGAMNHGHSLYDELVRIPLIFYQSGRWKEGVRVAAPASIIDLYPTLLDLMGWSVPEVVSGQSLMPTIRGEKVPNSPRWMTHTAMSTQRSDRIDALIEGRWKLIRGSKSSETPHTAVFELYDLARDPREQLDLSTAHPEIVNRLATKLRAQRQAEEKLAVELGRSAKPVELSVEAKAKLRSLGYVE